MFPHPDNLVSTLQPFTQVFSQKNSTILALCPPVCWLSFLRQKLENFDFCLGAQDVSAYEEGPHTGEISAAMLFSLGVQYCLVGHSERRSTGSETTEALIAKCNNLLNHNIQPILCVGETLEQLQQGATFGHLEQQLVPVMAKVQTSSKILIAYEPIWAIGTGLTPNIEQIQNILLALRSFAKECPLLYGGSVSDTNAFHLAKISELSGVLVGGASLSAEKFKQISLAFS